MIIHQLNEGLTMIILLQQITFSYCHVRVYSIRIITFFLRKMSCETRLEVLSYIQGILFQKWMELGYQNSWFQIETLQLVVGIKKKAP